MSCLRRLHFDLWYLVKPPWDSGIVPPEVQDFIRDHPADRALDLGCGTGTSSLALAEAGWEVVGVDFSRRAVQAARKKAKKKELKINFIQGDVTRLPPFSYPFSLVLDIGCFHGLDPSQKVEYITHLSQLLSPGGTWLMYGFFKAEEMTGPGLIPAEIDQAQVILNLEKSTPGRDKKNRPCAWFWFTKKGG